MAASSFLVSSPSKSCTSLPCLRSRVPNPSIPPLNLTQIHLRSSLRFKTPFPHHLLNPPKLRPTSLRHGPHHNPIKALFTGIVEEMGEIKHLGFVDDGGFVMKIAAKTVLSDVKLGDSIAVDGTCLTITDFDAAASEFSVGLSPETLRKTSLIELRPGSPVNLERALQPSTRMGGHFVQGHVDGTGEIVLLEPEGDSLWVKVFEEEECFNFMLLAYMQQKVVISMKKVGQEVNLEVDILGKYVERLLKSGFSNSVTFS